MRKSAAFIRGRHFTFLLVLVAFIRGRRLFKGGVYWSNYGTLQLIVECNKPNWKNQPYFKLLASNVLSVLVAYATIRR